MSLNWNATKVEGWKDSEYNGELFAVTECIVHRMMHTGIGWELTEKNAAEFYARCKFADKLTGELLFIDGKKQEITSKMINDHIGLSVNVAPETRNSFVKRFVDVDFTRWLYDYSAGRVKDAAESATG